MAGPTAEGWLIVAIHDSKESWEKFRDGTLMPRLQAGIEGGFAAPRGRLRSKSSTRSQPEACERRGTRTSLARVANAAHARGRLA